MSGNVRLSRNQKRALAALLEHKSITAAAQSVGLVDRTLARYLRDPDFRQALLQAEANLLGASGRRLITGNTKALDVLEDLIKNATNETQKRLAAQAWYAFALRWHELQNFEERLTRLEELIYENQ